MLDKLYIKQCFRFLILLKLPLQKIFFKIIQDCQKRGVCRTLLYVEPSCFCQCSPWLRFRGSDVSSILIWRHPLGPLSVVKYAPTCTHDLADPRLYSLFQTLYIKIIINVSLLAL
jgi:hypothetical protein